MLEVRESNAGIKKENEMVKWDHKRKNKCNRKKIRERKNRNIKTEEINCAGERNDCRIRKWRNNDWKTEENKSKSKYQ